MSNLQTYIETNKLNIIFAKDVVFFGSYKNIKTIIGSSANGLIDRLKGLDLDTTIFIIDDIKLKTLRNLKYISKVLMALGIKHHLIINQLTIKIF